MSGSDDHDSHIIAHIEMGKLIQDEMRGRKATLTGFPPPNGLLTTCVQLDQLLEYLRHNDQATVAVDTETTGLHPFSGDRLRGVSVATEDGHWYIPYSHPNSNNFRIITLVTELELHPLVFHHCTFDWPFLASGGNRGQLKDEDKLASATVWDTQVGNWLMDENLKVGLKESAERILGHDAGEEKRKLKQLTKDTGRTWDTFTAEDIGEYAAMDARLTYDLWAWQSSVGGDELAEAMVREMKVQRGVFHMNRLGVGVDVGHIEKKIAETEAFLAEMEAAFKAQGVNPRSTKDVARWLYDDLGHECKVFTKTGARSTSVAALTELAGESEEADAMLRQRKVQKELTAYYRPLLAAATDRVFNIATVHPHFSSTRTVTGRFSCSDPNLQTIPRDDVMSDVRKCFIARPGYKLVEFDLNQAELRVIAGYAQETNMIDALMDPERNLHDETALAVFGPDYTGLQRRLAKNLNFGFPYGIGPRKFAHYLASVPTECDYWEAVGNRTLIGRMLHKCGKCDTCRADVILQGYREAYPSLVHTMGALGKYADKHGRLGIGEWPGRYRHFRGAGYRVQGYTALNAIVQGGIGEFMKDMMIEWEEFITRGVDTRLVLQIHDALVFEIPDWAGTEALQEWLQKTADRINPFDLPMIWEMKLWK